MTCIDCSAPHAFVKTASPVGHRTPGATSWPRQAYADAANADAADRHGVRPLWVACATGDVLAAAMLLEVRADVNAADGRGCPPLCVAAQRGDEECVELLLGHAADANAALQTQEAALAKAQMAAAEKELMALTGRPPAAAT